MSDAGTGHAAPAAPGLQPRRRNSLPDLAAGHASPVRGVAAHMPPSDTR